ncbi:hypothetical protein [Crocosphaera sp.]|uniref:hypothetical protein n=1 Tax=Crocosphaera sp. TaxID=2729996 RepID=UPI003F25C8E9
MPEPLNEFFKETNDLEQINHLTIFIIIVYAFLYLAYLPNGWLGLITSFTATLALFGAELSQKWHHLSSNGYIFNGLFPLSDTNPYYTSALRLLQGGTFHHVGTLRPLSHGTIATILGLTQENLQATIGILVLITAISCFFLAREIKKYQGTIASALILTLMFAFIKLYIGSVATENLGLAVGALGTAVMWRGLHTQKVKTCLFGLFLLTIALNIRAGVFFILPAFWVWGVYAFRSKSRFSIPFLFGGFAVILLAFIFNSIIFKLVTLPGSQSNGNFAYVLYGMMVGGNWTTITVDHPGVHDTRQIYRLAFQAFLADPSALLRGFLRAWKQFFLQGFAFSFVMSNTINQILQIFSVVAIVKFFRQWGSLISSFMLMGLVGLLLSLPFAPPWDTGTRIYAATIPFFSLFPTLGLTWICEKSKLSIFTQVSKINESPKLLKNFCIGLTIFIILGTLMTKFMSRPPQFSKISCPSDHEVAYFFNSAGSSIQIVANQEKSQSYIPKVTIHDFNAGYSFLKKLAKGGMLEKFFETLDDISENTTIISKINLINQEGIWVITDSQLIPQKQGIIGICGQSINLPDDNWVHGKLFYADSMELVK